MAENTEKTSQHYIGSRLSLVSKMGVRYEGVLYSIDSKESTISLAKVRSFGTEDRPVETPIPPCELVFDYIVFKATDIKDLMVCELPGTEEDRPAGMLRDPAIISCSALPTQPQLDKMVPPRVLIESGGAGGSTLGRQSSPAFYGRGNFGRVPLSEIYRVSPPPPLRAYVPSSSYGGRPNIFPRRPFSVPPPPPPMQLDPVPSGPPTRFESDYDFQTANEKFKEAALDEKSAIDAMLSASKQMTAGDGGLAALRQRCLEEKGEKVPPSGNQSRDEKAREDQHLYYDKTASFFDSISCEDRPKGERNVDWNKERKTNEETFGPAAVRFMDQQNRRNHSNAFVDYGTGGGGGAMFVNRPPPMPPRVRYVPMVYHSPQIVALGGEGGARVRRWVAGTRSTAGGGRYRQELYLG